jgi:hypothetical protein
VKPREIVFAAHFDRIPNSLIFEGREERAQVDALAAAVVLRKVSGG